MSSTTNTVDPNTKPAATAPSPYYGLFETTSKWHEWSVSCLSCETPGWIVPGAITFIVANVLRVVEAPFRLLANLFIAIKNMLCGESEVKEDPKTVETPDNTKTDPVKTDSTKADEPEEPAVKTAHSEGFTRQEVRQIKQGATGAAVATTAGVAASYLAPAAVTAVVGTAALPVAVGAAGLYGGYKLAGKLLFPAETETAKPAKVKAS